MTHDGAGRREVWCRVRLGPDRSRGTVLLLSLVISILVGLTLTAAVSSASLQSKSTRYELDRTAAQSLADGVTAIAGQQLLRDIANFRTPGPSGTVTLAGQSHAYRVASPGGKIRSIATDGVASMLRRYHIAATVHHGDAFVSVERTVLLEETALFQHMIFSNGDLVVAPSSDLNINGRLHANGDLRLGGGGALTVDSDHVRFTGRILRLRRAGTRSDSVVRLKVKETARYRDLEESRERGRTKWSGRVLETWKGAVQGSAHGVRRATVFDRSALEAYREDGAKGHFHARAGLVIVDDIAFDAAGKPLTMPPGTLRESTLYNARELTFVKVTDIDLALLNSSDRLPGNGLLYAYRTDSNLSHPSGVRLKNGEELSRSLTVVSEDPVYVLGDFNTIGKKAVAIIADAVNLLSSAWDDSKRPGALPAAVNTTYNIALAVGLAGAPEGESTFQARLEDLALFHENWSGRTATLRGSVACLFPSRLARRRTRYADDVATAPYHDWAYDPRFNRRSSLPPFTPPVVRYRTVQWDDGVPLPFGGEEAAANRQ